MSYSFSIKSADKAGAKAAVAAEFDQVVASQPHHIQDKPAALAAANAIIDLLGSDDSRDICVSVNGSVGWNYSPEEDPSKVPLTSAAVNVYAYHVDR